MDQRSRYNHQALKGSFMLAEEEALRKRTVAAACAVFHNWAARELRDRRFRVTPELEAEVLKKVREGWTVWATAQAVGLSEPTVRKLVRRKNKLL